MAVKMNKGHIVAIALIGSLICNIFLAGWFIGFHWQELPQLPQPNQSDRVSADLFDALHSMPELDSRVHPILHQHFEEIRPKVHAVRNAKIQVRQLLSADSFEPAAIEQALNQVADTEYQLRKGTHKVFLEVLNALTPEERNKLAKYTPRSDEEHRHPPPRDGRHPRWKPLPEYDQDNDGKVTWEEFSADAPPFRQRRLSFRFKFLDQNKDGALDAAEMARALTAEGEHRPPPPHMMGDEDGFPPPPMMDEEGGYPPPPMMDEDAEMGTAEPKHE